MKSQISRRNFLKMAGVTTGAAVLAACAPSGGSAPAGEGSAPAAGEAIELVFWGFATNRNNWYGALAETYKEEVNPDVTIDIQEIAYQEMHDKVLTTLVAGTGAPDMADIEISRLASTSRAIASASLNSTICWATMKPTSTQARRYRHGVGRASITASAMS